MTGPDEYSAIADNNVYTNLMAQRNLRAAAEPAERHPERAGRSASTTRRSRPGATPPTRWSIPYDEALGVHPQAEGFTEHELWDFERHRPSTTRCCCTTRTSTSTASRS